MGVTVTVDAIRRQCHHVLREMVSDPENQQQATCPETGFTAFDINCGLCEDFAQDVIERLGGESDRLLMLSPQDVVYAYEHDGFHMDLAMDPVLMDRFGVSVPSDLDESTIADLLYSSLHLLVFFRDEQGGRWWFDAQVPDGVNDLLEVPLVADAFEAARLPQVRNHQGGDSQDQEFAKAAIDSFYATRRAARRLQAKALVS